MLYPLRIVLARQPPEMFRGYGMRWHAGSIRRSDNLSPRCAAFYSLRVIEETGLGRGACISSRCVLDLDLVPVSRVGTIAIVRDQTSIDNGGNGPMAHTSRSTWQLSHLGSHSGSISHCKVTVWVNAVLGEAQLGH